MSLTSGQSYVCPLNRLLFGTVLFITLTLLLSLASSLRAEVLSPTGPPDDQCYTQVFWDQKYKPLRQDPNACPLMGNCDIASVRDTWIPDSTYPITTLKMYFHVFRNDDGSNPAASVQDVADAVDALNEHYLPLRIQFEYDMRFISSTQFRNLTSNSEFNQMKNQYAIAPDSQLNVYVASVNVGGSVFSFGTFPWDPDALTNTGGIVMNQTQFAPYNFKTLTHEVGHNLGLWHTHHGVSEVSQCGSCYEYAGSPADDRGDFCSDTDPTPTNYGCGGPGGNDPCNFEPWGPTNPENHMGYGACRTEFSPQQWGRMQCWTNDVLTSWMINVKIIADTVFGPAPLTVNFVGETPKSVVTWDWNFGDGGTADIANPVHTYNEGGLYDVYVSIEAVDGTYATQRNNFIAVYADTLIAPQESGVVGNQVRVDIYANNRLPLKQIVIPFSYAGPLDLHFDSASTVGLRTEYVDNFGAVASDPNNKRAAYNLLVSASGNQPDIAPDTGAVMSLYFTIPFGAPDTVNPIEFISFNGYSPTFTADAGIYLPELTAGSISLCKGGDVDGNGIGPNIADLTYLTDYLFSGGPPPPVMGNADVNGSGVPPNVADLTYLVEFLFGTGPAPVCN